MSFNLVSYTIQRCLWVDDDLTKFWLKCNRGWSILIIFLLKITSGACLLESPDTSFWEVMASFVLVVYASLVASRTLLQWLLAYLNFILDSEDLFCQYKQKKWFLWTMAAANLLKTMEMVHIPPCLLVNWIKWIYLF